MPLTVRDPDSIPKPKAEIGKMSNLTLDETHQYCLDGRLMDGLTSTIQEAGLIRNSDPWYMERGTAIHLDTEHWDKETLDEDSVPDERMGYLESWIKFRRDQNYTPVEIEYLTYHPELMVGTKIDRLPLLDIKSGVWEKWHILQLALQWSALICHGMHEMARSPMGVYLDPDGGPPKVKLYKTSEMREAFKAYASMLHFIRWRRG